MRENENPFILLIEEGFKLEEEESGSDKPSPGYHPPESEPIRESPRRDPSQEPERNVPFGVPGREPTKAYPGYDPPPDE